MHEMALMQDVIAVVEEDAKRMGIKKVKKMELIVGDLSNVLPDALLMAFSIYKADGSTLLTNDAQLIISREKAKAQCSSCKDTYVPGYKLSICPKCEKPNGELIEGETFAVYSYEGS
ncbi:hydrogenase maturation nickel metallochaperone HypA [Bacillus taeanensis]|uniref:Hydrogenase maturation factor HypA n=1 Tax=Bacillus taeanensis TaxID=273032 RepID=A0A366XXU8_9BACI|nr:hydrogenase maturation nickel metallochaperone HypA [Bacillus taeanensis]RBW70962.1 hydrogenase maturation nickel metallochaperone HypA [Bacillus taeanensis]